MDTLQANIIEAGLYLFQFVYGYIMTSLQDHRFTRFSKMTAKAVLYPEALPPTNGAATQHILRAYLQYHDWLLLGSMTLPPTEFGWKVDATGQFSPIMTTEDIAPPELLKLTSCN